MRSCLLVQTVLWFTLQQPNLYSLHNENCWCNGVVIVITLARATRNPNAPHASVSTWTKLCWRPVFVIPVPGDLTGLTSTCSRKACVLINSRLLYCLARSRSDRNGKTLTLNHYRPYWQDQVDWIRVAGRWTSRNRVASAISPQTVKFKSSDLNKHQTLQCAGWAKTTPCNLIVQSLFTAFAWDSYSICVQKCSVVPIKPSRW